MGFGGEKKPLNRLFCSPVTLGMTHDLIKETKASKSAPSRTGLELQLCPFINVEDLMYDMC